MLKILKTRRAWGLPYREMRNRAGPKFENSYQKLNVPRAQQEEQEQHSNPSHDHAAKAAGKKIRFSSEIFQIF